MKLKSTRIAATLSAVVVAPLLVLFASQIGVNDSQESRAVGRVIPFDLPILDGERLSSDDLLGTSYLINFWNDWCIPCQEEHPALVAFAAAHAADPTVRLVGIVRDENSVQDIREYVAAEGVTWTVLTDPDGTAKVDFGTTGQPETFAIGPEGKVRAVHIGPASFAELEAMLEQAR